MCNKSAIKPERGRERELHGSRFARSVPGNGFTAVSLSHTGFLRLVDLLACFHTVCIPEDFFSTTGKPGY